jgi:hypothetical protein
MSGEYRGMVFLVSSVGLVNLGLLLLKFRGSKKAKLTQQPIRNTIPRYSPLMASIKRGIVIKLHRLQALIPKAGIATRKKPK